MGRVVCLHEGHSGSRTAQARHLAVVTVLGEATVNSLTVQLPKAARVFLLEDDAERIKWFKDRLPTVTLESTASDAVRTLGTSAPFDYLFLDYDLYLVDRRYGNGGQVARFLAGRGELGENCVIHSLNLGGAAEMKSILRDALVLPYGHFDIALEGA